MKLSRFSNVLGAAFLTTCILVCPTRAIDVNSGIKLTAVDAGINQEFGAAVAVSSSFALIGAHYEDLPGANSGAAYVFDATTGAQLRKLEAADGQGGDEFGNSVGLDGNIAIVGAQFDDDVSASSGSAYLFDVTTGSQLFKLRASDVGVTDYFGSAVDVSGNVAIVGAWAKGNTQFPFANVGAAYLFNVSTGTELFKLTADDGDVGDEFGVSVAISGNLAIVGARGFDGNSSLVDYTGAAYVFDVTTGKQLYRLQGSDTSPNDYFGTSVAIDGKLAVVGALLDDGKASQAGAAYVFDLTTGQQLFKLTANDGEIGDSLGHSVAISDGKALVGALWDNNTGVDTGSAYLFDVTTGEQLAKLTASDAAAEDFFGAAVAIHGSRALVGAFGNDDGGSSSGSAYLFVPEPATILLAGMAGMVVGLGNDRRSARRDP